MLRQRELFMVTMVLGALSWSGRNLMWLAATPGAWGGDAVDQLP